MTNTDESLASIAEAMLDRVIVDDVIRTLGIGSLKRNSGPVACNEVVAGKEELVPIIQKFLRYWSTHYPEFDGKAMAKVLKACVTGIIYSNNLTPTTEIVWTGPKVEGSYVRSTREVVKEIIRNSKKELLVVGYWLAASNDGEGIIEDLIELLSDAVKRGVEVTMILDERKRNDGTDNKQILLDLWHLGVRVPTLLTWHIPPEDRHLKLHAKVMVADKNDGLLTSANLTMYALDRNIEMGIRVVGQPAKDIVRHFALFKSYGELTPM